MKNAEEILTYMGFHEERTLGDYLRHLYRFWDAAASVIYHVVISTERVVVVRVSNPFDSFLFGPLLLDGLFYFPRLRWFRDRVLENRLDKALETNLKKWAYPVSSVSRLEVDNEVFAIALRDGTRQSFRLKESPGARMTSLGGNFPYKANFLAATEAFNRLAAGGGPADPGAA